MKKVAIIGTAGRNEDGDRLRQNDFGNMVVSVHNLIKREISNREKYAVISGGAAWADHVAVYLFLLGHAVSLDLELPCALSEDGRFVDNGDKNFIKNPGGTSNYYHELFSKKIGFSSFRHLKLASEDPNCQITSGGGFFDRNSKIAEKADHTIALTFGAQAVLKDGGTADTMKKFLKKGTGLSFHIDLKDYQIYSPAIVK